MWGKEGSTIVIITIVAFMVLSVFSPISYSSNKWVETTGAPPVISNFTEVGPLLAGDHNNQWVNITCDVDDTANEGDNILSADISIDGGPWLPMNAVIPPFDSPFEKVTITWNPGVGYYATGVHNYVVRATDADGGTNPGVADSFTIVDTTTPSGAWLSTPGATWEIGTPCSFLASYEDFTAYDPNIANSYFEYRVNLLPWMQFAWVNDSFAWGSYTNVLNYTMATGGFVDGDVVDYRGFIDDTGGGTPVQLTMGTVILEDPPGPVDPYPIYGYVRLYDGTSAGGYAPLTSSGGATVQVKWWNVTCNDWSSYNTVTNAAGQYSVDILNYTDGGVVFVNATFEAPYHNKGYNYTFLDLIGSPGGQYLDVICGIPYEVNIIKPTDGSNFGKGIPIDVEYEILDMDGLRVPGYYTFFDGPMNLSSSGIYVASGDQYFDGTVSVDPGHYDGAITINTVGNNQTIIVAEGGLLNINQYLTPWGEFYIDPNGTIPGYLNDFDQVSVDVYEVSDIQVTDGWSLVSLPLIPPDEALDEVLSSIDGKWDRIQTYDSFNDIWLSNMTSRPDSLNDLKTLNHKMGFWINITEPNVTLTVMGTIPVSTSIQLYAGWNLVGYPTINNTETVANALWGTGADSVMVCDTSEPYRIKEVGPTYIMKPGEGYWIHVVADTVWVVDW